MKRLKAGECLVTKTVRANMCSWHDESFKYPTKGYVEATSWIADEECGNGLHGFLNGAGDSSLANLGNKLVWLVIKAQGEVIDKVKFKGGEVIFCGSAEGMTQCLISYGVATDKVISAVVTGGNRSTLIIKWWTGTHYRIMCGYVDNAELKAGVAYKLDDNHQFIEVKDGE